MPERSGSIRRSRVLHGSVRVVVLDRHGARPPREHDQLVAVRRLERLARQRRWPAAPNATCRPFRQSTRSYERWRSPRRGSTRAACDPPRAARRTRASIRVGAGGVHAGRAARRAAARGRPGRARGRAGRAGAGRPRARRSGRRPGPPRPTRSSAAPAASRSARRGGQPPAARRERAHERHVERGDREVEPGAVGLRDVGRAARSPRRCRRAARARRGGRGRGSSCRRRWVRARRPTGRPRRRS